MWESEKEKLLDCWISFDALMMNLADSEPPLMFHTGNYDWHELRQKQRKYKSRIGSFLYGVSFFDWNLFV